MSAGFLKALDVEIAELEEALAALPEYRKLVALRSTRTLYGPAPEPTTSGSLPMQTAVRVQNKPTGRRVSPEREAATRFARGLLEGRDDPTPIDEIYEFVLIQGVQINGQEPKSNLSAMLSKTDGFKSHGRSGWTYQTAPKVGDLSDLLAPEVEYENDPDLIGSGPSSN